MFFSALNNFFKMGAIFFISSPILTFTEIGPLTFPEIDLNLFFLPVFFRPPSLDLEFFSSETDKLIIVA